MYHLKRKLARELYLPELQELVDFGQTVATHNGRTSELLDYVSEIEEPWHHCILVPSRQWNPWLAMSEALWILAGRDDVAALKPYNSHIDDYSDDGVHLYGAYGARIFEQIDPLIERLRKDPNDRRAVLQIWDNHEDLRDNFITAPLNLLTKFDLTTNSKDPPCNNMVYFKLRDGKLHMTVICRSNDIHWGLFAVNIPTFGILQEYIAARLGVGIGHQTHVSNSLHVYTDNKQAAEITDRMLYRESEDLPEYPEHAKFFEPSDEFFKNMNSWPHPHESFAKMCSEIIDGTFLGSGAPASFYFAKRFLKEYRDRTFDGVANLPEFSDWTMAGKLFTDRVWKKEATH
jgi:thymidylate synthase